VLLSTSGTVSGADERTVVTQFPWTPANKLTGPVATFLGCSEAGAKEVLSLTGGNLKEVAKVRQELFGRRSTLRQVLQLWHAQLTRA